MTAPLWLLKWWKLGVGVILGALLIFPLAQCRGEKIGRQREQLHVQQQINAALERDRRAREIADRQRVADQARTAQTGKELHDAIDEAQRVGSDPAVALACRRLMRLPARQRVSLPAACGRGSGDGAQAGAGPGNRH